MLNITPQIQTTGIIIASIGIAFHLTLLILNIIFIIRQKKTGKPNPLFKEWP